ncbi:hypothetical protein D3C75_544100 [compost metagenome]
MQQNAWPACAKYHREHARWSCDGRKSYQRHAHSFFRPGISANFAINGFKEKFITETTTAAARTALAFAVIFNLNTDRKSYQRANICRQSAVSCRHQNQFIDASQAGRDFLDALICRTSHTINTFQDVELLFTRHALQRICTGIKRAMLHRT